jgi:hypothetical protein
MASLLSHIQAFREGPEIEGWDADAYEVLTQIPGLALGPLSTMLSPGAGGVAILVRGWTCMCCGWDWIGSS